MHFDLDRVRSDFPALADGVAYFDGPGGSQVPRQVAAAVAATMTAGLSNRGTVTASERRAEDVVVGARSAVADLLGCDADGVVFARSMTQATYDVSRALARQWVPGDQVVVTRLDHDSNIRPWVQAAERVGAEVRWVGFDRESGEIAVDDVRAELTERTKVVAVTGASNVLGTRPDLPAIAEAAHAVGALVYVDGVHLTPHAPVDVVALGADFYGCSPYKFFGPHHGVLVAAPAAARALHPGQAAAVDRRGAGAVRARHAALRAPGGYDRRGRLHRRPRLRRPGPADPGTRVDAGARGARGRALRPAAHGLRGVERVRLHGAPARRTPTAYFSVDGRSDREVYEHLAGLGVNAPASSFYAIEASRWLGLGDSGAVRAGLAPYTSADDVDRLLAGVADVAVTPPR